MNHAGGETKFASRYVAMYQVRREVMKVGIREGG